MSRRIGSRMQMGLALTLAVGVGLSLYPRALAQVEHKEEFKPQREVMLTAAPPAHVAARRQEFAQRDNPQAVALLAQQLFGLLRLDWTPEPPALRAPYARAVAAYQAGRYAEALDAYKEFYVARLVQSGYKGANPADRTFVDFFTQGQDLVRHHAKLAALTRDFPPEVAIHGTDAIIDYFRSGRHDAHHIMIDLDIGPPGEVNWTYELKDYFGPTWLLPRERTFLVNAYSEPAFFKSLLTAYDKTGQPEYLQRWAEYIDDYVLNYDRQVLEAGVRASRTGPGLEHLAFVLQRRPEAMKLLPSTTLVRLWLRNLLSSFPVNLRDTRIGGPNRIMHIYGRQLTDRYLGMPELKDRDYLLRERRRSLEGYARTCVNPDGTGIDYAPNYNANYIIWPVKDMTDLRRSGTPSWLTPAWEQEYRLNQTMMATYLVRSMGPGGLQPGFKRPLDNMYAVNFKSPGSYLRQNAPQALEDADNRAILAFLGGDKQARPSFRSYSFPYGGYYYVWEDWKPEAQFLYLNSYRPGASGNWRQNNNIFLGAFGRYLLMFARWESPVRVDGQELMYQQTSDAYPSETLADPFAVVAGRYGASMAYLEPQPNRFHDSAQLTLVEGTVKDWPYAGLRNDGKHIYIPNVTHQRQIVFARAAGLWVVTDRLQAPEAHTYQLLWGLRPGNPFPEGSIDNKRNPRAKPANASKQGFAPEHIQIDAAQGIIRTANPDYANLTIHHVSPQALTFDRNFLQQDDRFGNMLRTGPTITGSAKALVVSLLHPRPNVPTELAQYVPVRQGAVVGFDARTPAGESVSYRTTEAIPGALAIGDFTAAAEALLVGRRADGSTYGLALGAQSLGYKGRALTLPAGDCEFALDAFGTMSFTRIYKPMNPVRIEPGQDRFTEALEVRMRHDEPDTDIRYTLDGTPPTLASPLYTGPLTLRQTTWVMARAFRKGLTQVPNTADGTLSSAPHWAIYTKEPAREPELAARPATAQPGLWAAYYPDNWTLSALKLPLLRPARTGTASALFDLALRQTDKPVNNYALVYRGYIEIPRDGVYNFHAPPEFVSTVVDSGYDLRLWLGGEEWYPATRRQNYGVWSVPLKKGSYRWEAAWIDQRPEMLGQGGFGARLWKGQTPEILVDGPDLPRQPLPSSWFWRSGAASENAQAEGPSR